jgi:hypothetical protein
MSWWTEHVSDKNRKTMSVEQAVRKMQKMKLGSAFAKLQEATLSSRDSDTCIRACATLWEGLVKFVSLCAFLLLILRFDSAVCNFLQISCSGQAVLLSRELSAIQQNRWEVAETNLHVHAMSKRSKSLFFSLELWIHKWLDARLPESEAAGYHGERLKRLQDQTKERALEEALIEALEGLRCVAAQRSTPWWEQKNNFRVQCASLNGLKNNCINRMCSEHEGTVLDFL